jgi:large subunit ribosomal protein L25
MAKSYDLKANHREIFGKKVKQLRAKGVIPANIFGGKASVAVQLDKGELEKTLDEAGETGLIYISISDEKKKKPVLVSDYLRDPVTNDLMHVDFQEVKLSEKIEANIPVVFESESPAVKAGGVLVTVLTEIPVKALPTDFPESFVFDLSKLENIGDEIRMSSIVVDAEKVELLVEQDALVALVQEAAPEEVAEETPAEAAVEGSTEQVSEEAPAAEQPAQE